MMAKQKSLLLFLICSLCSVALRAAATRPGIKILENSARVLRFQCILNPSQTLSVLQQTTHLDSVQRNGPAQESNLDQTYLLLVPRQGIARLQVQPMQLRSVPAAGTGENLQLPTQFAEITDLGIWRGLRLARLVIHPAIWAQNGQLSLAEKLEVRVTFPDFRGVGSGRPLDATEQKFLRHVLNPEMARLWRSELQPQQKNVPNSAPAMAGGLKIYIHENGMYRLDFSRLQEAGFQPQQVNLRQLHLWNRGKEVPIFVAGDADSLLEPGESLYFWGQRLAGEDGWYNDETDENVYWLNQHNSPALR
ncbi:MAG: hypothetical protein D6814_13125, partial [Calditrichaeota bacterium]